MHAVVLSFPGHFFQTLLSVKSLEKFYPEIDTITFVLDDVESDPWLTYVDDFAAAVSAQSNKTINFHLVSQSGLIQQCVAGWWRQQLIKLTLDQTVPGDHWFVVDGDTVFESRCEIRSCIPITCQYDPESNFSKMSRNYVQTLLGIDDGSLRLDTKLVCTNAIPFRYLDTSILTSLRQSVETRFNKNFVQLHLDWFADQTIVADWNPPTRMVMSEWELIECYKHYVLHSDEPMVDIGSGYRDDVADCDVAQTENVFRHSYRRDTQIVQTWFEQRGLVVPHDTWHKASAWYQKYNTPKIS